ncbi:MAG: hypothetical protein ACO3A2_07335 [Bdellovibrionia bacterium]
MKSKKSLAVVMTLSSLGSILSACGGATPQTMPPAMFSAPQFNPNGTQMTLPSGCIPLTQPIQFSATGMFSDPSTALAGAIPYNDTLFYGNRIGGAANQAFGTITPSGALITAPPAGAALSVSTAGSPTPRPDGSLTMNIFPSVGTALPMNYTGLANATGTITISPQKLTVIYGLFGLSYPNTTTSYNGSLTNYFGGSFLPTGGSFTTQQPCVSGVSISMTRFNNVFGAGRVYLYLNNTRNGAYLQF